MTGSTYATGKPFPPREKWVPRVFHRLSDDGKPMFYVIDLPADDDVSTHAELNPGTLKIEDGLTGEVLWSLQ